MKDQMVQDKVEEAAKLIWQTDTFTLNLVPALLVTSFFLCKYNLRCISNCTTTFLVIGVTNFILFQPFRELLQPLLALQPLQPAAAAYTSVSYILYIIHRMGASYPLATY